MADQICDSCGRECEAVNQDFGYGDYEYGSQRGYDSNVCEVSDCCEADIVPGWARVIRTATHVARKDHAGGRIKAGQKYQVTVTRHVRENGPAWITTRKKLVK